MLKWKALSALAVLIIAVDSAHGQRQGATSPSVTALDQAEIEMLYARSNLGLDSAGENGYIFARTFTPDGVLVNQNGTTAGHKNLAKLAAKNKPGLRHWVSNLMIEPSAEGAVGWAYILHVNIVGGPSDPEAGAGNRNMVTEGGLYHDIVVRTPDGWRFKKRSYIPGNGMPKRDQSTSSRNGVAQAPQGRTKPAGLTALDYAEIKRLVGQYNLGYDNAAASDGAAMVGRSFTPDAFFERAGSNSPWNGRKAIIDASARTKLGIHHWVSNLLIDQAPEGARSWSSLLLFNVDDAGTTVQGTGGGILHETYTKTPEGWQIKYRRYEALGTTPAINWPSPQSGRFLAALAPEPKPRGARRPRLSSHDHIDIEQLYIRNNIAFDSAADGGHAFARTFTPDGELVTTSGTVAGHQSLAQLAAKNEPGLHTWMSNLMLEASREGATGWVGILTAGIAGGPERSGRQNTVTGGGLYQDELVKTPEGWRFKKRTYVPGVPDLARALSSRR